MNAATKEERIAAMHKERDTRLAEKRKRWHELTDKEEWPEHEHGERFETLVTMLMLTPNNDPLKVDRRVTKARKVAKEPEAPNPFAIKPSGEIRKA